MNRVDRGNESGFTLIEVLIASVLLIAGVAAVLAVFPQAYRTTTDAGHLSVLSHLANEKMEELRSLELTASDLSTGIHPSQSTDSNGDKYYAVAGFGEEYSLRWVVTNGPTDGTGTAEPDMRTVVVQATFMARYTTGGVIQTSDRSIVVETLTFVY